MNHDKVHKAVEDICHLGCTTVNEVIETLQQGEHVAEAEELDHQEREALLKELKTIMDVYERK